MTSGNIYLLFKTTVILIFSLLISIKLKGSQYFVSADALTSGNGSITNPWKLQSALNHPKNFKPGDTVWIRGGIYLNNFDS